MNKQQKKLLEYYRSLPDEVATQLLDYAEFLAAKYRTEADTVPEPEAMPRPEKESVVAAVKRLSATYFMIDKDALLDQTASLVSQHMLQGRNAVEVIDELEALFRKQYDTLVETFNQDKS